MPYPVRAHPRTFHGPSALSYGQFHIFLRNNCNVVRTHSRSLCVYARKEMNIIHLNLRNDYFTRAGARARVHVILRETYCIKFHAAGILHFTVIIKFGLSHVAKC